MTVNCPLNHHNRCSTISVRPTKYFIFNEIYLMSFNSYYIRFEGEDALEKKKHIWLVVVGSWLFPIFKEQNKCFVLHSKWLEIVIWEFVVECGLFFNLNSNSININIVDVILCGLYGSHIYLRVHELHDG